MKKKIIITVFLGFFSFVSFGSFPVTEKVVNVSSQIEQTNITDELPHPKFFDDLHWGGFLLGFFLGWIGLLFAWIFSDDPYFINAAWKGAVLWSLIIWILGEIMWWGSI
tara:strand:- start:272 stop:598 length:327 start_codon:yes stop_codon:yes gene_type:complete